MRRRARKNLNIITDGCNYCIWLWGGNKPMTLHTGKGYWRRPPTPPPQCVCPYRISATCKKKGLLYWSSISFRLTRDAGHLEGNRYALISSKSKRNRKRMRKPSWSRTRIWTTFHLLGVYLVKNYSKIYSESENSTDDSDASDNSSSCTFGLVLLGSVLN